ncbi:hypothetical protein NDU88_008297 [Pleurodeles waltl]|uniref:Uncharacterized protein n=1 Tax=Pleurodeles waltl TaxID=8319 RepID=A0AAV7NYY5_PLEWA|nr:hypothetical protein NDU88_008297 [Pleurodeles waltl]
MQNDTGHVCKYFKKTKPATVRSSKQKESQNCAAMRTKLGSARQERGQRRAPAWRAHREAGRADRTQSEVNERDQHPALAFTAARRPGACGDRTCFGRVCKSTLSRPHIG